MTSKLLNIVLISSVFLTASFTSQAERVRVKDATPAKVLIKSLKLKHIKFNKLMKMRSKVDSWEQSLTVVHKRLYGETLGQVKDLESVKKGEMKQTDYQSKWEKSGRKEKASEDVREFRIDIKKYNHYRLGYNLLAKELAKHLQRRKPEQIKSLIKNIELLIANLQLAINSENYAKAEKIAKASQIATEFGYIR